MTAEKCHRCQLNVRTLTHRLCCPEARRPGYDFRGRPIPPAAWDDPDPDDPPATEDDDPMWGRPIPPAEETPDA